MNCIVQTASGAVEGLAREGYCEFRGIPYAAAPVGEARFRAPQPQAGWVGVRKAQAFGTPAPQELSPLMGVDRISDDCLFLNIWTPSPGAGAARPVLVWLHGGGYLTGCGHQMLYNGARLAALHDVVVVTCNYRLGLFGFGHFAAVLGNGFPADTNLGTRDQVAALAWVRENIAGFGGDAGNVTVFGESAGGMSVATLMAVPAARGLFRRAIVQSGGADYVVSPEDGARVTSVALDALAGSPAARVDALLRGEPAAIVKAQRQAVKQTVQRGLRACTPQFGMSLLPIVDGDFLPQRPIDAIAGGCAQDIDLLASVTRDEWNLFVHQPQFAGGRNEKAERLDEERLLHVFERALPGRGAAMLAFYRGVDDRKRNGQLADLLCWMESDRMFRVPTQRLLAAQAAHRPAVYAAQFEWENPLAGGILGACHVVDVPFVFGVTGLPVGQYFTGGGAQAEALSLQVMAAWAAFARDGEPAPIDGTRWPAYGARHEALVIGPRAGVVAMPGAAVEQAWQFLE